MEVITGSRFRSDSLTIEVLNRDPNVSSKVRTGSLPLQGSGANLVYEQNSLPCLGDSVAIDARDGTTHNFPRLRVEPTEIEFVRGTIPRPQESFITVRNESGSVYQEIFSNGQTNVAASSDNIFFGHNLVRYTVTPHGKIENAEFCFSADERVALQGCIDSTGKGVDLKGDRPDGMNVAIIHTPPVSLQFINRAALEKAHAQPNALDS